MSLLLPLHYERAQVAAAAGDFSKIMGENDVVFVDGDDMPIGATPLPLKVTKSLYVDATALSASATVNPGAKPLGAVVFLAGGLVVIQLAGVVVRIPAKLQQAWRALGASALVGETGEG